MSEGRTIREPNVPDRCWLDPRVVAQPSPIEGLGLFAVAPITSGDAVGILGGRVIDDEGLARIAASRARYNSAAIGEGINVLLDDEELIARGNHSCDSNLWMRDAIAIEARRDIRVDEEVTIDYSLLTVVDWEMRCNCHSSLCRRVVRGTDWTRTELQERYRHHFSPFINERICRAAKARA